MKVVLLEGLGVSDQLIEQHTRKLEAISAVTFGVGHIVNLLTGHGSVDTVLQMGYAIAIGFAFVMCF